LFNRKEIEKTIEELNVALFDLWNGELQALKTPVEKKKID
jgi:hypothetical protein